VSDDVAQGLDWLSAKARAAKCDTIVLAEQGIGEQTRATALCVGIRAMKPQTRILLVGHYDGTMAKFDMAAHARRCAIIDEFIAAPTPGGQHMERGSLIATLRPHCQTLYDAMPIVVREYSRDAAVQAEADNRIAPYGAIYHGFPFDNWRLIYASMGWWDYMHETAGVPIDAKSLSDDLFCAAPTECSPLPDPDDLPPGKDVDVLASDSGSDDEAMAVIQDSRPYAVIHSGAGFGSVNKIAPKAVTDAIIRTLESKGVPCVQVGLDGEQDFRVAYRRKGLRLPLTNRLIQNALVLVDNEGLLPYMAQGLAVHAAVLFSVTPYNLYGLPGNLAVVPGLSKWQAKDKLPDRYKGLIGHPRRCGNATCFWGGDGWWTHPNGWCWQCRAPLYGIPNPEWPACINFPRPRDAADAVWSYVDGLLKADKVAETAVEAVA